MDGMRCGRTGGGSARSGAPSARDDQDLGGTRNGWWQVPHAWRPKSLAIAWTWTSSLARAASRSLTDQLSRFFAALSNSLHFCQISGLAFDLSLVEPWGKSIGMCSELRARVSALTATASIWPALILSCASFQLAPLSFIRRWRSAITSPEPIFAIWARATPTTAKPSRPTTTALHRVRRRFMPPPSVGGRDPRVRSRLGLRASLRHLVLDRRDGLQVPRDRQPVLLRQVLEPGRRPLDDLCHQPTRHVTVRLVAGLQVVGDLIFRPRQPGLLVGGDVRHRITVGTLRRPAQEA